MVELKNEEQFALMREAGLVVARTLELLRGAVKDGVTTKQLDELAEDSIRSQGAVPSFKGYGGGDGVPAFPGVICASINNEIVHGIPGEAAVRDGDIISIDCGAIYQGWHGDSAITVPCGEVPQDVTELMRVTEQSMWHGIAAVVPGERLNNIGRAIQEFVRKQGSYGIVEGYGGHGIGSEMHMDPMILNHRTMDRGPRLRVGMAVAIEPMINLGRKQTWEQKDGWTVNTLDGSPSAHFEHTVCITEQGLWVTTAMDGGKAGLAPFGNQLHP
ncbi:MAG TPA: type I methionyl aminopeptidase [Actinocrinis sp.]|nr:type I methionyl aminopeptidase [Actinocrinis sp.]